MFYSEYITAKVSLSAVSCFYCKDKVFFCNCMCCYIFTLLCALDGGQRGAFSGHGCSPCRHLFFRVQEPVRGCLLCCSWLYCFDIGRTGLSAFGLICELFITGMSLDDEAGGVGAL